MGEERKRREGERYLDEVHELLEAAEDNHGPDGHFNDNNPVDSSNGREERVLNI